jgi:hypothetical protein
VWLVSRTIDSIQLYVFSKEHAFSGYIIMVFIGLERAHTSAITQPKNVPPTKKFKVKMAIVDGCALIRAIRAGRKYKGINKLIINGIDTINKSSAP